jgi:hypothetical protein
MTQAFIEVSYSATYLAGTLFFCKKHIYIFIYLFTGKCTTMLLVMKYNGDTWNPCGRERLSTLDFLVLTSTEELIFMLKILLPLLQNKLP